MKTIAIAKPGAHTGKNTASRKTGSTPGLGDVSQSDAREIHYPADQLWQVPFCKMGELP